MEINPRVVFERLFGGPGNQQQRLRREVEDRSILDSIKDDLGDLRRGLGASDSRERRASISTTSAKSNGGFSAPSRRGRVSYVALEAPVGVPAFYGDHVRCSSTSWRSRTRPT